MKATLFELSEMVGGKIIGDGNKVITSAQPAHTADANAITFLQDSKSKSLLDHSKAAAAVVPLTFTEAGGKTLVQVEDVLSAFTKMAFFFRPPRKQTLRGISHQASISPSAQIGEETSLGPGVYIGEEVVIGKRCIFYPNVCILDGAKIGDDTILFPNVTVYENCQIGARCIIHSGAVIGAYGFGYDSSSGKHILSVQLGNVVLGDEVEVGACSTIDRGTFDSTFVGDGTKIDNQVQIGHNCSIGRFNLLCAQVGMAGSTTTGDYAVIAGQAGIRDHLTIGDYAVIGAMAGVMADVPPKARIVGIPATPEMEQMKKQVALAKLPDMRKEFIALKKETALLQEQLSFLRKQIIGDDSSR